MGELKHIDTELTLRHAHNHQLREAVPPDEQVTPPAGSFNLFVFFNLQAAFDEGHAILGIGPVDGPLETYSFYRDGNAMKAPGRMACLEHPVTFQEIIDASGWITQGQPGNFWNEHLDSCLALWCGHHTYRRVRACAESTRKNPGTYNLVTRNCLDFVEEALRVGDVRLTTLSGLDLHTIVPKDAFEDVTGAEGAERFGAWKYWFPVVPPPFNDYRTISAEP